MRVSYAGVGVSLLPIPAVYPILTIRVNSVQDTPTS